MRAGNGVSPDMRDQLYWNELRRADVRRALVGQPSLVSRAMHAASVGKYTDEIEVLLPSIVANGPTTDPVCSSGRVGVAPCVCWVTTAKYRLYVSGTELSSTRS
jgi:hypothetical protein